NVRWCAGSRPGAPSSAGISTAACRPVSRGPVHLEGERGPRTAAARSGGNRCEDAARVAVGRSVVRPGFGVYYEVLRHLLEFYFVAEITLSPQETTECLELVAAAVHAERHIRQRRYSG